MWLFVHSYSTQKTKRKVIEFFLSLLSLAVFFYLKVCLRLREWVCVRDRVWEGGEGAGGEGEGDLVLFLLIPFDCLSSYFLLSSNSSFLILTYIRSQSYERHFYLIMTEIVQKWIILIFKVVSKSFVFSFKMLISSIFIVVFFLS